MSDDKQIFLQVLRELDAGGVLQQVVLIGSWTLPVYRLYFDNDPTIPLLRTTDVDFLIGMPPRISVEFDVPIVLSRLGFQELWAPTAGYCKYVHPAIEVEFLIPELGRGVDAAVRIEELRVFAQPLRYLQLAYDHSMVILYEGTNVRVPRPEAFVLLKLLVLPRRQNSAKAAKDSRTVRALSQLILQDRTERLRLVQLFETLRPGWQKTITRSALKHVPDMAPFLNSRE